ncbi:hypothetical protein [Dyadobacter sp. 676]|uniref:Response regulator transcription factor n=1 Tax=Dyadobacter sp. 676 TaxID=3088362 RepID=A0AAU8FIE5_9BACT
MSSIVIIDLQPLSCLGMQAYLNHLLPGSKCKTVYRKDEIDTFQPPAELQLIIVGFNQEDRPTATLLMEKVLMMGANLPIIVMYDIFDSEYLRQFAGHTPTGFISKDNVSNQLLECIQKVSCGQSFLCEKTGQHVINAYTLGSQSPTYKQPRKKAGISD